MVSKASLDDLRGSRRSPQQGETCRGSDETCEESASGETLALDSMVELYLNPSDSAPPRVAPCRMDVSETFLQFSISAEPYLGIGAPVNELPVGRRGATPSVRTGPFRRRISAQLSRSLSEDLVRFRIESRLSSAPKREASEALSSDGLQLPHPPGRSAASFVRAIRLSGTRVPGGSS